MSVVVQTRVATMADLPPEIMDHIALEARTPRDLMALTRINKAWRETVYPDHLLYSHTSASVGDRSFWNEMSEIPRRAHLVRRLDITGSPHVTPNPYQPQEWEILSAEQVSALDIAGHHFSGLHCLDLRIAHIGPLYGFFKGLRTASPSIVEMKMNGLQVDPEDSAPERRVLDILGGYKMFTWTCQTTMNDQCQLLCALGKMLSSRCPNLTILSISQRDTPSTQPAIASSFWQSRMPNLVSLFLDRVDTHILTADFLRNHPKLDSLNFWDDQPWTIPLRELHDDTLPALKHVRLRCSRASAYATLAGPLPDGTRRPINAMRIWTDALRTQVADNTVISLCRNLRGLSTLTRLEFGGGRRMTSECAVAVALIGHASPQVRDVALSPAHESQQAIDDWVYALSMFAGLQRLSHFSRHLPSLRTETTLKALASTCSQLKTLDGRPLKS